MQENTNENRKELTFVPCNSRQLCTNTVLVSICWNLNPFVSESVWHPVQFRTTVYTRSKECYRFHRLVLHKKLTEVSGFRKKRDSQLPILSLPLTLVLSFSLFYPYSVDFVFK